jgi:glycosyltransferase involved in cell wall biosynthesis
MSARGFMRILHVTTFLQGGAGRVITQLARAQARHGHDVRLVTDAGGAVGYGSYPEYERALHDAAVPLIRVRSTFTRETALNRAAAGDIARWTHAWAPDLVHAHAGTPGVVARLAGFGSNETAPIVHTMHGWGIHKTPEQAAADLDTLRRADGVATPSRAAAAALRQLGLRRTDVQVLPYGIEDKATDTAPDAADVAAIRSRGARAVALCIGTIGVRKNQRLLIESLPFVRGLLAVFVGDGDTALLHKQAAACGVGDRVLVLGHRPDASRYLALADALVLPSRNEGLPLAVLEALRAGVPVVATALPEIVEAVSADFSAHLFASDNAAALADRLRAVCQTPRDDVMSRQLRQRYLDCYTEERMTAAYEAWYRAAVERARTPADATRHFP